MLAVNAWDESPEVIEMFVRDKKLAHPILLRGRTVAREKYGVRGIPATFWIDRAGRVARYKLDFVPGDERDMERITEDLL